MHSPFSLDLALNLVWVAIGLGCAAVVGMREFRGKDNPTGNLFRRAVALFVLMIALFPSVSLSDDEVSFWFLNSHSTSRGTMGVPVEEKEKATQNLARMLDAFQHYQVPGVWSLSVTLYFLAFICMARTQRVERLLIQRAGRAPPVF